MLKVFYKVMEKNRLDVLGKLVFYMEKNKIWFLFDIVFKEGLVDLIFNWGRRVRELGKR